LSRPSDISSIEVPPINARYGGTIGSTQGDRNDRIPASVAIIRDSPIDASMISIPNMANLSVYIYLRGLLANVMP
jgi:hypothetical protein